MCYFNGLSLKVFEAVGRKRQKGLLLFLYIKIIAGISEPLKRPSVLGSHLFRKNTVQFIQGIECHFLHIYQDVHGNDLDMPFYSWFPARGFYLRWCNHGVVMFSPGLKVFVHNRTYPVLVPVYCDFAVIRCNCRCHSTKICESIVINTDPVFNVTINHALCVEVIAVSERCNKNGNPDFFFGIPPVMKI